MPHNKTGGKKTTIRNHKIPKKAKETQQDVINIKKTNYMYLAFKIKPNN